MSADVTSQMLRLSEGLVALFAFMRLFSSVRGHVSLQITSLSECFEAFFTLICLLFNVALHALSLLLSVTSLWDTVQEYWFAIVFLSKALLR